MVELWQLYDEDTNPLVGSGATKDDVLSGALLHGASHVWIWRYMNGAVQVLLQKRAKNKRTWPDKFDISAAGHIDLGESPEQAAIRETKEEIGVDISASDLKPVAIHKAYLEAGNGNIENEFQWVYLLELGGDRDFHLQESEVASLVWVSLDTIRKNYESGDYVPHGTEYYEKIFQALENLSKGE